jgi:hypothetical protein
MRGNAMNGVRVHLQYCSGEHEFLNERKDPESLVRTAELLRDAALEFKPVAEMAAFGFHTEVVPLTVHVSDITVQRYDSDGVHPVWHKNIACEHVKAELDQLRRKHMGIRYREREEGYL